MKYYIITDTHFGHDAMLKYCGRGDDFEGEILRNLKLIPEHSILIHLGDFSWEKHDLYIKKYFVACQAQKHWLIRGNHDKHTNSWYEELSI